MSEHTSNYRRGFRSLARNIALRTAVERARTPTATADTGHKAGCQEFPTGWLCVSDCTTVWHDKDAADTGLRERVEAWLRRYDLGAAEHRESVLDLRAALSSTEDRADNEGGD